jgi:membrane protease YdiL (CAAX protease family)
MQEAQTKTIDKKIESKPQRPLGWGPAAAIFVSLGAYIVSQLILIFPITIISYFNKAAAEDFSSYLTANPWLELLLSGISAIALAAVLWVFLKQRKRSFKDLGFKKPSWSDFGWLAVAVIVYFILLSVSLTLAGLVPGFNADQQQDVGYNGIAGAQLVLAFIGLVILPPLAEEMMFRGFMYRGMASKWPKIMSALLTSALFGLVHFQWNVGVDVFVLSLVLIALYEKTKNLWMCVGLHAIKNFIAFLALFVFATMR